MTITVLPAEIVVPTRDRLVEQWKRSHRLRLPGVDTGTGTEPDKDARISADMLVPLYAAAKQNGEAVVMENARGAALNQWGEREGVGDPNEASGASGAIIVAGSGSITYVAGDELVYEPTGFRYVVITTDTYAVGTPCPIVGKDTGPNTDLPAGAQLKWTSPRPGSSDYALVLEQSDGSGLTGGRDKENDDEYYQRISYEKQNRAASGNAAEYILEAQKTPNVAIQKVFAYPGIRGPGTICLVFTMLPSQPGGSRIPNATHVSLVESHIAGEFPADDGAFLGLLVEEPLDVSYGFTWADNAPGWADVTPWPIWYEPAPLSGPAQIRVSAVTDSTHFTLATANAVYTAVRQPKVGQTIGFYDRDQRKWRRKRILSFTGTGPWVVTCDTSNGASDTSYAPLIGQPASPWADSLGSILYTAADPNDEESSPSGVLAYMDTLGPGEQVASFYDRGQRQRRVPTAPSSWGHETTTRGLIDAITAVEVEDVQVLAGDGVAPSVGEPGVLSNILRLRFLSVYPEP